MRRLVGDGDGTGGSRRKDENRIMKSGTKKKKDNHSGGRWCKEGEYRGVGVGFDGDDGSWNRRAFNCGSS